MVATPSLAPTYVEHRFMDGANDTLPIITIASGIDMSGYRRCNIQVVPDATANPTVRVQFWSVKEGAFIDDHSALAFAAKGAGVAYDLTIDCNGRRMLVAVTAGVGGGEEAWVYVSGVPNG